MKPESARLIFSAGLFALTVLAALPPAPARDSTDAASPDQSVQLAALSESQASTIAQRALIDALAQQLSDSMQARSVLAASHPAGDPVMKEADRTVRNFLFAVHDAVGRANDLAAD